MIGMQLAHYRIEAKLGAGGMGEVFVAQDTKLERRVALKVLPTEVAGDRERLDRFEREAKALAALDHPNIVTVFSVETAVPRDLSVAPATADAEAVHFLTMQLVEGEPLSVMMPPDGMPIEQIQAVASQLASALAAAHEKGIIHRDLKPDNVMLSDEGRVRVLDFGLAKLLGAAPTADASQLATQGLTQEGMVVGTMPYMAPEQVQGREADHRSDLFSLGTLLYEMTTGTRPFAGNTSINLLLSIVQEDPQPVSELRPEVPGRLAALIERCLEKEPNRRPQSASEVLGELESARDQQSANSEATAGRLPTSASRMPSLIGRWAVGLAVIAVVVFLGRNVIRDSEVAPESLLADSNPSLPATEVDGRLLNRGRVLVAPFENRTGDAILDPVGLMASDWVAQGLTQAQIADVVSSISVLSSLRNLGEREGGPGDVGTLAGETGAGTVVSGAYYRQGDDLLFSAEVHDAIEGALVGVIEPLQTPLEDPLGAVETLRQQAMVIVASHLNARTTRAEQPIRLPSFDGYRAYTRGLERFIQMDFRSAIDRFVRAADQDPDWAMPLLAAAMAHINLGEFHRAESLANRAQPLRESLSALDQHFLDRILATCDERVLDALHSARLAAELAPEGPAAFDAGAMAIRLNFAREAVDRLGTLDPERGFLRGFLPYWHYFTSSHHVLGDYEAELVAARRSRELFPDLAEPRWLEIRALTGQGRFQEVEALLDEAEPLARNPEVTGNLLFDAASELEAHGEAEAAGQIVQRGVDWYVSRSHEAMTGTAPRASLGRLFFLAGDLEQAREVFAALAGEHPEELEYRGYLGIIAAGTEDAAAASDALAWFEQVDRPYLFGSQLYWQSAIHAWMGELDASVRLFREALSAGMPFGWPSIHPHADWVLRPLWDYPPFQEAIGPRV